jgi:hypothetical protein
MFVTRVFGGVVEKFGLNLTSNWSEVVELKTPPSTRFWAVDGLKQNKIITTILSAILFI